MSSPLDGVHTTRGRVVFTILAILIAIMFLLPFLWMVVSSIRPSEEIFDSLSPLSIHVLVPNELTLSSYADLAQGPLGRSVINSLIITVGALVPGLVISAMAAFAFSVMPLPFRNVLFMIVAITFMIPFDTIAIPLSAQFRDWNLQNTYMGLILPGLANGLAVFVLRQFFLGIPFELSEAARIDGASWWRIFWRIYIPLSKPALIGAGLMFFLGQWQAYLWPLLISTDPDLQVAPVALAQYLGQFEFNFGAMFAGATLVSLLPAVLLLLFQPYFTQSISSEGIK